MLLICNCLQLAAAEAENVRLKSEVERLRAEVAEMMQKLEIYSGKVSLSFFQLVHNKNCYGNPSNKSWQPIVR